MSATFSPQMLAVQEFVAEAAPGFTPESVTRLLTRPK
jgi:hypothetical protein